MSRSLRVNQESIDVVKSAMKLRGFPSQQSIAEELGISRSTISKFFSGKPIDFGYFVEICERLGFNWQDITQFNEVDSLYSQLKNDATRFKNLQVECDGNELNIQAIEKKSGGAFVIRVEVPPDAHKASIEEYFWQKYKLLLEAKEEQIAFYHQENTRLLELINTLSTTINHGSFPSTTHIENLHIENLHLENSSNRDRDIISELHSHEVTGDRAQTVNISAGEIKKEAKIAGITNESQQQNIADTALEIQHLLEQSEHYYPVNSTTEKTIAAEHIIEQIESSPTLKHRVINAIKEGGLVVLENVINNYPIGAFVTEAIKGWKDTE